MFNKKTSVQESQSDVNQIMVRVTLWPFLAALCLIGPSQANFNEVGLDCWDVCIFEASDEPENHYAVEFYYTLVERLRFNRMYHGVNATALLIDSSIHKKHLQEPDQGSIFSFQQNLASLISFTTPADATDHPVFVVQFDENQAWYCDTWGCNGRCEASDTATFDIEDALVADTEEKGKVEDACYLAGKAIMNEPCGGSDRNPMVIAITNSKFDDHIFKHHHYKDSSCKKFRHRMHVGTHYTVYEMEKDKDGHKKRFASSHNNNIMVNYVTVRFVFCSKSFLAD